MSEEEQKQETFVVGTISIDANGIWHVHSVGLQEVGKKKYFGNGVDSNRNIAKLLTTVGNRLFRAKNVYLLKIGEVLDGRANSSSVGSGNGVDNGGSVG